MIQEVPPEPTSGTESPRQSDTALVPCEPASPALAVMQVATVVGA